MKNSFPKIYMKDYSTLKILVNIYNAVKLISLYVKRLRIGNMFCYKYVVGNDQINIAYF